jgi:hypothetical protein
VTQITTGRPASSSGSQRRPNDAAAQQRALKAMGVEVPLDVLKALPNGGWIRFVPQERRHFSADK